MTVSGAVVETMLSNRLLDLESERLRVVRLRHSCGDEVVPPPPRPAPSNRIDALPSWLQYSAADDGAVGGAGGAGGAGSVGGTGGAGGEGDGGDEKAEDEGAIIARRIWEEVHERREMRGAM